MRQKLTDRDRMILQDLYDYNGLPKQSIIKKHFKENPQYGSKRLWILQDRGYIDKVYYYAKQRNRSRRVAAILYVTYQGLKVFNLTDTVSTLNVKPKQEKLDIHYLLGELYSSVPQLISGKAAREKYDLKNYMPIKACSPNKTPTYIFIIGKDPVHGEAGRIRSFTNSLIRPGDHVVISRQFFKQLKQAPVRFVPWPIAPEVVPNGLKNKDHYLDEFRNTLKSRFPNTLIGDKHNGFQQIKINNKLYSIADIFYGNTDRIRQELSNPSKSPLIYAPSRLHFPGIKLENGSFLFYSRKDEAFFEMTLSEKSRMVSRPYQL